MSRLQPYIDFISEWAPIDLSALCPALNEVNTCILNKEFSFIFSEVHIIMLSRINCKVMIHLKLAELYFVLRVKVLTRDRI